MMQSYNLCIIKPNKSSFSETFVQQHIDRLAGNKKVLYGGAFPVYDHHNKLLIKSVFGLISYLIQKKLFKKQDIKVRTQALVNYFKAEKTDVVFAEYGMVGAMVTDACMQAGIPLVIHFHGADAYHKATVATYIAHYKKAFVYASAIIAVSADMVERLKELGAPANKIYNASCGVDTGSFTPVNVAASSRNFLFVGRFVEKKSPASVVKAFRRVVDKFADAHLWMAGQGPLFDETVKLINELNLQSHITPVGVINQEELRKLMQQMRCFVQHSVTAADGDKEGTPVSVLESVIIGFTGSITRHAGIKEAVIDGQTGLLCDEYDIDSMGENMIRVAASVDLAVQLGKAGREHMIANYDINSRIKLLDTIIENSIQPNLL